MTPHFPHRLLRLALSFLTLCLLAACSSESSERQAFAEFLQTRILDKPGIRLLRLTEDDKKRIGRYAAHYEVIVHHYAEADTIMGPVKSTLEGAERFQTMDALMNASVALGEARSAMAGYRQQLATRLEQTERERAALSQADDLKTLFDAAYRRTVTDPATLIDTQIGLFEELLAHYEALATYLDANRAVIKAYGMTAEVADPQVQAEVHARMAAIKAMQPPLEQIKDKLHKIAHGK